MVLHDLWRLTMFEIIPELNYKVLFSVFVKNYY